MAFIKTRPATFYILFVLMAFQGLSAMTGILLILDPTGKVIDMSTSLLAESPFNDFFFPGLILFVVLGIFPLIVLFGLWRKATWSWYATLLVGMALLIWIVVEIIIVGYQPQPPLQIIYGSLGLMILFLTLLPSVRNYFFVNQGEKN